jgi:hypothetical protein
VRNSTKTPSLKTQNTYLLTGEKGETQERLIDPMILIVKAEQSGEV